jgi:hypothetical protein
MKKSVKLVLVGFERLPYIVAKQPIMRGDLYLNTNGFIKECFGGETNKELDGCLKVMVKPSQLSDDDDTYRRIDEILVSGGDFEMEMEDEFTNPKAFENMGWGDGLPRPIFVNNKIKL